MSYYGSWKLDRLLTFTVNTRNPTSGHAQNADAVPSYHVYEDETATPILTGTMSLLNNPNTIGYYSEQITLSAANGFEVGKSYNIYIRAVVANITGTMGHSFQMEADVNANTVSAAIVVGNVTGSVFGNVNGSVGSILSPVTVGNVTGSVLGNVNGSVNSVVSPVTVGTNNDKTGYGLASPQSVNIIGNISGTISNVLNVSNPVTVGTNNDKTGYSLSSPQSFNLIGNVSGTFAGNLTGSVGSVTDIGTTLANKIADFVLRRSFANARASSDGDSVSFRSLLGAIAKLVNRWNISGSTLTVYAEDDATSLGTQTLTSDASAEPITQINTD